MSHYDEPDSNDRDALLTSRNSTIDKLDDTTLWLKVIEKAIEDIVYFKVARTRGRKLNQEQLEQEASAHSFLFNDEHIIPFDDYLVTVTCPGCNNTFDIQMSLLASGMEMCRTCSCGCSTETSEFVIKELFKQTTLKGLFEIWGMSDIKAFRKLKKDAIDKAVERKLYVKQSLKNRARK